MFWAERVGNYRAIRVYKRAKSKELDWADEIIFELYAKEGKRLLKMLQRVPENQIKDILTDDDLSPFIGKHSMTFNQLLERNFLQETAAGVIINPHARERLDKFLRYLRRNRRSR